MKKTRFTEEQMVTILREADERSVPEVAKKHGVSAQTIFGLQRTGTRSRETDRLPSTPYYALGRGSDNVASPFKSFGARSIGEY
jgi:hypothetical protein